ncbi:MAG: DUF1565 domain-containing protein, partial [Planctomycetota bacterium]
AVLALLSSGRCELVHVDSRAGDDSNPGTQDAPLRTIEQAAKRVTGTAESTAATVIIAPGIYSLDRCVTFRGERIFTEQDRLTIRSRILPDDPEWSRAQMPVIVSAENPRTGGAPGRPSETYSLKIQTSHVTIRGLKFLGNPSLHNWHACVERIGPNLDDLLLTQCMFVGNRDTSNVYCAALATGNRFVVDHCVFSGCHACTVYWDGLDEIGGKDCAMRHCIVTGALISAVWTCQTSEDFAFHHNVVADSQYVWMRKPGDRQTYRVANCALIGNKHFSGYGVASGPTGQTGQEVSFDQEDVITDGRLVFTSGGRTRLAKQSGGYDLGAGLFKQAPEQDRKQAR